jgi:hypothetical protein
MGVKQFLVAEAIPERSTYPYQVDLETDEGVPINPSDVSSIELTLRDLSSDAIVNGRDHLEVKNQNGGVLTAGRFTFTPTEDDTRILGAANIERRLLTLHVHAAAGGGATHQVYFYVRNFRDVS